MGVVDTSTGPNMEQAGLVYAFAVKDGQAVRTQPGSDAFLQADYTWVHVNLSTEPGRQWLLRHSGLAPQLVATFADRSEEPGVTTFGSGLMLVLDDRLKAFDHNTQELSELHMWVEPARIITARWHPLAATDALRFRLEVGTAPDSAMALSLALLEELVSDIEGISRKNGHRLDLLEDRVLDDETDGLAGELGSIRRLAITLRRRVLPLRQLVNKLADVLPPWVGAAERQRLDPLVGRVDRAGGEILESQEQARLLQDEIAARAAERNGRNIYILSVLTVFFLPLNLITGFFGMNVGGMPGVGSDIGTLWVTVFMVVIGVLSLWIFRWMRWL